MNTQPTIELNGDLDRFGDGSIYIHRAVSHTPGSQIALIRLPKTGLIVLTSDLCYSKENLDKDILPSIGLVYDRTGMLDGYHYVKGAIAREHGDVILPTTRSFQSAQALAGILRITVPALFISGPGGSLPGSVAFTRSVCWLRPRNRGCLASLCPALKLLVYSILVAAPLTS